MIDDQEAIARQSAEIDRLQRQLRGSDAQKRSAGGRDSRPGTSASGRFMNYSHYYVRTPREGETRVSARSWDR
jgi:hypothetical protein